MDGLNQAMVKLMVTSEQGASNFKIKCENDTEAEFNEESDHIQGKGDGGRSYVG